jgi:dihydrofolate reductase
MISIIVAIADNNAIGRKNQLLWHISEDLKYFKHVTDGHTVIMGLNTRESIGRALPNRRNIVISRIPVVVSGAEVFFSIPDAIAAAYHNTASDSDDSDNEVFIIGGGEIYRQFLPLADRLYLTLVHTTITDADTFFPDIDYSQWREIFRESHPRGENFEHPFDFIVLER